MASIISRFQIVHPAQANLGNLSDASELRARLQFSVDLSPTLIFDLGYDFTRWHASFTGSTIVGTASMLDENAIGT